MTRTQNTRCVDRGLAVEELSPEERRGSLLRPRRLWW
jgi:hypothetical protein